MGRARDIANVLSSSTNIALDSELGLSLITPTSITATGGTGSIGATGAVTFSGVSSVSLNGVFSSAYDNYKILVDITSKVTATSVFMRMRANGIDNSSTNYNSSIIEKASNGTTIPAYAESNVNRINVASIRTGVRTTLEIFSPQLTQYTSIIGSYVTFDGAVNTANDQGFMTCSLSVTNAYDGFTLYPASGTITGTVKVYGYRN